MKRIVYTRPDGGVSVVVPAIGDLGAVVARAVPEGATNVEICEEADIPDDRTFREAWKRGSKGIDVEMPRARHIHMDRIRAVRDKELARLDVEQLKGADVTAEKQSLRDIPQTFDLTVAETPDELKALWPDGLPKQ